MERQDETEVQSMSDLTKVVKAVYERFKLLGCGVEDDQKLPPEDALLEVCQVLLNVSCMREESRFPSFRVCFIKPDSAFLDAYLYSHVLRFDEPIPFAGRELHKLAPALNSHMSYLMLDISTQPFTAIGILASYTTWDRIMTRELSSGTRLPRIPNIAVAEPGRLEACFGEAPVVSYKFGSCIYYRTDTFTSTLVANQLRNGSHLSEADRLGLLYRIIWIASNYGHGGQIYIVPSEEACGSYVDIKYRLPGKFLFTSANDPDLLPGKMIVKEMIAYADLIAKFSLVDGAVVLTKDLDLLGFGAETIADMSGRKPPQMCFIGHDNQEDVTKHFRDNGMRHRASYRLCDCVPDSVSIIISQDGIIKACTKHEGKVVVYDHVALPLV